MNDISEREMLPSKKNHIYREQMGQQEVVVKQFTDPGRFRMEKEIGELLQDTDLCIPRRLAVNEQKQEIIYEYIASVTLVDLIETTELEWALEKIAQICAWMMKFYTILQEKTGRQYILGDVHLRNFICDDRGGLVYGVDFEECRPGRIETDVARLYTFILHYEPAFTARKIKLSEYVQKTFLAALDLNEKFYLQEVARETEELLQRRHRRYAENPGTGR